MLKMKKFLPILVFIIVFSGFLVCQILIGGSDSSVAENGKKTYFENLFNSTQLRTTTGAVIDLEKEKAPLVVLNFWASWCNGCIEEIPSLVELSKKFKDDQLKVIAINTDNQNVEDVVTNFKRKFSMDFPIVSDINGLISRDFEISALPVTFIFQKGKLIQVHNGAKDFASAEMLEYFQSRVKDL